MRTEKGEARKETGGEGKGGGRRGMRWAERVREGEAREEASREGEEGGRRGKWRKGEERVRGEATPAPGCQEAQVLNSRSFYL